MIQNDLDLFKVRPSVKFWVIFLVHFQSALNAKLKSDSIIKSVRMKYGYDFYFYNQRPESFLVVEFTLPWLRKVPTQISNRASRKDNS